MPDIRFIDSGLTDYLKAVSARLKNHKPMMEEIGEVVYESVQQNFEDEGRPKWKKLKKSTERQRARLLKWPGKILNRSGESGLSGSINYAATDTSVSIGTAVVYAPVMNFGHEDKKIPARPFLELQIQDEEDIKEIILDYILRSRRG